MAAEPPLVRVLRETLEEEVAPTIASSVLFEALSAFGPELPATFNEVLGLMDGPLRSALYRKIGAPRGKPVMQRLEERLTLAEKPTAKRPSVPPGFSDPVTRDVPQLERAVPFQVAARSRTLAILITSTLGPSRVRDIGAQEEAIEALIIDGTDVPKGGYGAITRAAQRAQMTLFFGAERDAAKPLRAHLDSAEVRYATFESTEGLGPILDLLRSRAAR